MLKLREPDQHIKGENKGADTQVSQLVAFHTE